MFTRFSGKSVIYCLLALALVLSFLPATAFAKTYTNRYDVDGSMYTSRPNLIQKLNQIFDGNASVYSNRSCTSRVDTRLGRYAVKNNGATMYVGKSNALNSGTSCWIYANGVYYTLFGEVTGNGSAEKNSEKLYLSGNKKFTYSNFNSWNVRREPGALVRVNGSHSIIVLSYDSSKIRYLDGNGDGQGIIAVREYYWSDCPWYNKTVNYVIQPTDSYFNNLYPSNNTGGIYGVYCLVPKCAPNSCLDAANGGRSSGSNVQIYQKNGKIFQKFRFQKLSNGYYTITNEVAGLALDVSNGIADYGSNVQLYTPNGTSAQQWKLIDLGNGYYYIVSKLNSNMVLDVYDRGSTNGTNVHLWEKNGTSAQMWKLVKQ